MASADPLGLYLHIPFCEKKCPYCDFNTYAGLDDLFQRYVDALCRELGRWAALLDGRTISTVFLGGGTPTVLTAEQLAQLFETVHRHFRLSTRCEISSEANPGTVDRAKFSTLRSLGVNRLSMGVQSFHPEELRFLGRIHDVADVFQAFETARSAGFDNINLDFMFGLPHQSADRWRTTLDQALALSPEHLSLYSLIVEPNTPLHHWVQTGRVEAPDEDNAALHYEMAREALAQAGYVQYEVSNWARTNRPHRDSSALLPAFACQHNLIYWRNQEYLGVGPGAHSHLRLEQARTASDQENAPENDNEPVAYRWGNRRPVPGYIKRVNAGEPVVDFQESIDPALAMGETMMLGLRLVTEGVSFSRFRSRHGCDLRQRFTETLQRLDTLGLLHIEDERVRLSERGLMLGNQVFAAFLP